jgi:uncharacterized protein (DUF697 family)
MATYGNPLTEYNPQMEGYEFGEQEQGGEVFSEQEEMELAAELLEVSSEQELEQFLGGLISSAGKALGGIIKGPIGKTLGGALKGLAKKALPIAGGALGTFFGGPVGTAIGGQLGSMAGSALGLETEGLSAEDREFEVARQFVRMAGDAVKTALEAPPSADPHAVAQTAVGGVTQGAPGHSGGDTSPRRSGRWIRRGGKIVLFGV